MSSPLETWGLVRVSDESVVSSVIFQTRDATCTLKLRS
jgi:hypothetical protein